MKNHLIVFLLLLTFNVSAQNTQFAIVEHKNKKSYFSSQHKNNSTVFKNQPYELKRKLQNVILNKEPPNGSVFRACFSMSELDMMKNNKAIIFVEFIVDQTGKTISAAVLNREKGNYSLSENSVNCLIARALNQNFQFKYIPTDLPENFLTRIAMNFIEY